MSIQIIRSRTLTILAALIATSSLHAATIKVPLHQPTISDAITAANNGDKIVISKGVYTESLLVDAKKNLTIKGKGKVVIDADNKDNALMLNFCDGVKISNLTFRNADVALVHILHGTDNLIEDCVFLGEEGGIEDGLLIQGGSGNDIVGSRFSNAPGNGIDADTSNLLIGDCKFVDCGQSSEHSVMRLYGSHITVESNQIKDDGKGMGIYLGSAIKNSSQYLIRKNKIAGVGLDGIFLSKVLDSVITGNVIKDSFFDGIDLQSGADGNTLKKNRISGSGDMGIEVSSDQNFVSKNRIKKSGASGIVVYGPSDGCSWIKNRIRSSGNVGLYVFGDDHYFEKNNVKGSNSFDLQDESAPDANMYVQNTFGTVN